MIPEARLDRIVERSQSLQEALSSASDPKEIVRLSQAYAEIERAVRRILEYRKLISELAEAEELLADPELRDMAQAEANALREQIEVAESALREELAPPSLLDRRAAVIEIRAGAGGLEAARFAADLVRMYERYAQCKGWLFEIVDEHATDLGGSRETVAMVRGKGVFACLKHEAGVHRVQRVPETESAGRIHTSTATVAVLPEPDEVEIEIRPDDIRIDTMRASGAGGQHVNVTDSAVRITHIPSGIVVISSEKSQHRNRAKAMQVLRARLFERKCAESAEARATDRRGQIGTGDRSERIRTYNFPQGRVTDHRIGLTLYDLPAIISGSLGELVENLTSAERAIRLAELES